MFHSHGLVESVLSYSEDVDCAAFQRLVTRITAQYEPTGEHDSDSDSGVHPDSHLARSGVEGVLIRSRAFRAFRKKGERITPPSAEQHREKLRALVTLASTPMTASELDLT